MTYEQYIATANMLQAEVDQWSAILQAFPKGDMGLVPKQVRETTEYKIADNEYSEAFAALRSLNASAPNSFKRKAAQERRANKWNS